MHYTRPLKNIILFTCLAIFLSIGLLRAQAKKDSITREQVQNAAALIGLPFSNEKCDSMLGGLNDQLRNYQNIRKVPLLNNVPPAILFNPIPAGFRLGTKQGSVAIKETKNVLLPKNIEDVAFYSIGQLASLIKSKKITSTQLTKMYLERLKKYAPRLECVVTLTESLALAQAKRADEEIGRGKYRGLLHGIPYGAKDLLSTKGVKTTWGSVPYKDQVFNADATVIKRLKQAGAVLIAKLSMGELAMGDVWFGGTTKNPWNIKEGSSGSSAGSASATSAGLLAFAIGTETWGSIVSPSTRCGVTGLRPTYGRVSRTGAMALSWSMDKIGPICRTAEDCAIVFGAIYGEDGIDQTLYNVPFNYDGKADFAKLKIGYIQSAFDSMKTEKDIYDSTLATFRKLGATLIPIVLPKYPINDIAIILTAEAAAAFDDLTRNGKDDLLVAQAKDAWPNIFRTARFIPAVEYIQANRVRYLVIQEMAKVMNSVDVYLVPPFEGDNLLLTNLTGHPCVVLPNGFNSKGEPTSLTIIGKLFDEATLLAVAKAFQDATTFHLKHPAMEMVR